MKKSLRFSMGMLMTILIVAFLSGRISCFEDKLAFEEKLVVKNSHIRKVHIVSMNHLDVGFNHFLDNVLNLYFTEFFPRAIKLSEELRRKQYTETFIYTTHPWLVSMYMECMDDLNFVGSKVKCPSPAELKRFKAAVSRGDITWHAGPMNMQFEFMDQSLAEFALSLSQSLDEKFKIVRKFRTMSQRDVPGLTQTVIPLLNKMGVVGLSVGVNAATSPPSVPPIFNWWYGNQSVIAMWHPGGYPDNPGPDPAHPGGLSTEDCLTLAGLDEALCFAFRSDNQGPPVNVQEILNQYEILRAEFPNAELKASTLESFMEVVYPLRHQLPNVTAEIGDTWIQGIQSDPKKVKEMKSFLRFRKQCLDNGDCSLDDSAFFNASRLLLKTAEHTWGRNGVFDQVHWTNTEFLKVKQTPLFVNASESWVTQRHFTYLALYAVRNQQLAEDITYDWITNHPRLPELKGFVFTGDREFSCDNQLKIRFNEDGFLESISDEENGVSYEGDFGRIEYRTYNQSDFHEMDEQYTYRTWFRLGVEKPNMTVNAHPDSRVWPTHLNGFYQKSGSCDFYAHLVMMWDESHDYYGAPDDFWIRYKTRPDNQNAKGLDVTVQYFNKRPTRLPEALFYSFRPVATPGGKWQYQKLGHMIDPLNVVVNGSKRLHAVDERVIYNDPDQMAALEIVSRDVALVSTITPSHNATVFPLPLDLNEPITGSSFNFFNNIWNVNYIFWYPFLESEPDDNFLARFQISIINSQKSTNYVQKPERILEENVNEKL